MDGALGVIKLIDFGVSCRQRGFATHAHGFRGTPGYLIPQPRCLYAYIMNGDRFMAPEVKSNSKGYSLKADIWSLGATIFAFLTGKPPLEDQEVLHRL